MRTLGLSVAALLTAAVFSANVHSQQPQPPLRRVQTIALPGINGAFDHLAIDLKNQRLFLTAEDHKTVEVLDLRSGKNLYSISGLDRPHYVHYFPAANKLVVVDNDAGIKFFRGDTFAPIDSLRLHAHADSSNLDSRSGWLYTDHGGEDAKMAISYIGIIDTRSDKHLADIRIDSPKLEAMALESKGPRLFVNDTGRHQVAVVDRNKRAVIAAWPLSGAEENVAMALDESAHRLFVATRKPPELVVLDSQSGRQIASLPTGSHADDMSYDAARKRVYISAGEGYVSVYQELTPDKYELLAKIPAGQGGKTSLFVPQLNRLYVAVSNHGSRQAKIEVFQAQ